MMRTCVSNLVTMRISNGVVPRPWKRASHRRLHSDAPSVAPAAVRAAPAPEPRPPLTDLMGRRHNYLRISLTERCNLRCQYCMPADGVQLSPRDRLLTPGEVSRLVRVLAPLGIEKVRLTGGEPTVSKHLADIIRDIREVDGIQSVSMTTNGLVLTRKLVELQRAGLSAVNISLDSLKADRYETMARRAALPRVLAGIDLALQLGLESVKVNTVLMKGFNDDEICDFVEFTKDRELDVRFIEFMPFSGNAWDDSKLVPYRTALRSVTEKHPDVMACMPEKGESGTARMWQVPGYRGRVGFIASMTNNFCATCNRLRITADGNLKVCLFGAAEVSLRDAMRAGATDDDLEHLIRTALNNKKPQHAESRPNGEPTDDSDRGLVPYMYGVRSPSNDCTMTMPFTVTGGWQPTVASSEHTVTSSVHTVSSSKSTNAAEKYKVSSSKHTVSSSEPTVPSSKSMVTSTQHMLTSSEHTASSSESTITAAKYKISSSESTNKAQKYKYKVSSSESTNTVEKYKASSSKYAIPSSEHTATIKYNVTTLELSNTTVKPSIATVMHNVDYKLPFAEHKSSLNTTISWIDTRKNNATFTSKLSPHKYSIQSPFAVPLIPKIVQQYKISSRAYSTENDDSVMTHLDKHGKARMVDVGDKPVTSRAAEAQCFLRVGGRLLRLLRDARLPKGDALTVAQIAGVVGAKKTADLIPMCHPLPIDCVRIKIELPNEECENGGDIKIHCEVKVTSKTGAEMEALTGASVAALALYDMCKSVDKYMKITDLKVIRKSGGRSGNWPKEKVPEDVKIRDYNKTPIKPKEMYAPTNMMYF